MARKKRTFKSCVNAVKLRGTLFRIWFMKNLMVWIRIGLLILLVCIFTGNITANTPILGKIVYPIFAPLIDEINQIVMEKEISGLMDFFTVSISILISISLFTMKAKNIAQSDIKNTKLKIALIQANLYFNSDGRLVKRVEKLTKEDINGDDKVADTGEPTMTKGIISGTVGAIKEFFVIATTDLSGDDANEKYDETLDKTGMKEASKELEKLDKELKDGAFNLAADRTLDELDKKEYQAKNDKGMNGIEKIERISFIQKLRNKLLEKKEKKNKELPEYNSDIEVISNNIDRDSHIKKKKEEKSAPVPVQQPQQTVQPQPQNRTSNDARNDFLKRLKKK